jgi:tRNA threonylcarbamoyladenosine biosynthesis protein TsaB
MAYILCLETATAVCSVAIFNDNAILSLAESEKTYAHASEITLLIKKALEDSNLSMDQIEAVAVGEGPGSYTGLRVGISTAKGICFAKDIPLIGLSTLKGLAAGTALQYPPGEKVLFCPMIDARRMEVYLAIYDHQFEEVLPPCPQILDENSFKSYFTEGYTLYFSGDGSDKFEKICSSSNAVFTKIRSSAAYFNKISHTKFEQKYYSELIYFSPRYLKDPHITIPKKLI